MSRIRDLAARAMASLGLSGKSAPEAAPPAKHGNRAQRRAFVKQNAPRYVRREVFGFGAWRRHRYLSRRT